MQRFDAALGGRLVASTVLAAVLLLGSATTARALEKAVLQLKWLHHCQFAGYYVAKEKGFYREAGLEVTIREGGPAAEVENDVAAGRADFGVGTSALLLNLAQGQEFVVLGQIFQHSPAIFLTPAKTGIRSIEEMAGRRFMYSNQHGDMRALLKRHGVDEGQIAMIPHRGDPRDLIKGKADVMLAYSFNEPYILQQAGEPFRTFSPLTFGIDFYGDNFFTRKQLLRERPEFVRAFREATLKGWRYALEHREETAGLVQANYAAKMDREHLLFELRQMEPLIQPTLVELGYQSLSRWQRIAGTFAELDMLPANFDPAPIIYAPRQMKDYGPLAVVIVLSGGIIAVLTWLLLTFRSLNAKLKGEVEERLRAEQSLDETQQLFDLFLKHTPVYTFLKEIDGEQSRVLLASDNFIEMIGIPADKMRGRTMEELFPAEFARKITADDLAVLREGKIIQLDEEFGGRSYTTIKFPISRAGKTSILAGFTLDITPRKRAEEALHEERQRLAGIIEGTNVGTWEWNVQTGETTFNERWAGIIGYTLEELAPVSIATWERFSHPDDLQTSNHMLARHFCGELDYYECEARMKHRDGSWVWVLDRGKVATWTEDGRPLWMFGTHQDITERKRAEEERQRLERKLLHAQKLESLGVLAGGVAHDFNNILMAIIGNADLALMKLDPAAPVAANLRQIEQSATRAADLAKQMLAYSGKGKFVVEHLDLNRLLAEMLHILEVSIPRRGVLHLNLTPGIPPMEADAGQIRQLIMNLVVNAAEAIGEHDGCITVTTACRDRQHDGTEEGWLEETLLPGRHVCLEIADNGCGMDSETLGRVFDPFFTTKFTGRGLGLAAVLGIVRGHHGGIRVQSEPGRGTTVTILFPALGQPAASVPGEGAEDDWRGHGTVLLVDDEETVREIGTELLKELGFTPITACNGAEAVEICSARKDISLVILDLVMPHMDGERCFRELQRLDANLRIILSSGYSQQEVAQRFLGTGLAGFIQKPYKIGELRQVLRQVV
jgi:PAS domain S-box-containing protein